jgi:hypothetical protein
MRNAPARIELLAADCGFACDAAVQFFTIKLTYQLLMFRRFPTCASSWRIRRQLYWAAFRGSADPEFIVDRRSF